VQRLLVAACAALGLAATGYGQSVISLTSGGASAYTQDFNSLGTATVSGVISPTIGQVTNLGTAVNTNLNGWYAAKLAGSSSAAGNIVADNGGANSGAVYNYGSTGSTNRSLGALASGSLTPAWGALIRNDTGQTLTSIQLSFTAKFWRSSTTSTNTLTFGYQTIDGVSFTTNNFLTVSNAALLAAANIIGPAPAATSAALDGNLPSNQVMFTNVIITNALSNGQTMFIRWQDFDATGTDAGLAIDDVIIGIPNLGPSIVVDTNSVSSLTTTQGLPSVSANFTARGGNLSNNITVTAADPANFAVSTDASSGFTDSLLLYTNTNSAVTNTPVYVRLTGSNAGFVSNIISLSSPGATTTNVAVSGTVLRPELASTTTNITGQSAFQNSPSSAPYSFYTLTGTTITNSVNITMPPSLQVSTNAGATFSNSVVIAAPPGATSSNDVLVRISSTAPLGLFTNFITNSTLGAASNVVVRVVGEVKLSNTPTIFPGDGSSLSDFTTIRPNPSTNQQISVRGTNLSTGITISAPSGWQVSVTDTTNFTASNITLPLTPPNTVAATPVYIRLAGTNTNATSYTNSQLRLVSGTTTNTVFLSGKVNDPPELNVSTNELTNFITQIPAPSASQPLTASGLNLTSAVTVTPPPGWQVSATNTNNFSSAAVVLATNASGELPTTELHVRLAGTNAAPTNYVGSLLTVVSGTNTNTVSLSGAVTLPPAFNVVSVMTNFVTVQGRPTTPAQFFQLSASNLLTNVLVTAPADYQVSANPNDDFTNVIEFSPDNQGLLPEAVVFVRLLGNVLGASVTNVAVTSGGSGTNVPVRGNVTVAPTPTVSLGTSITNVITATQGVPSAPVTFSVGGANLASNVTVVAPTHYEISEAIGTGYRTNIVLQPNASYELLRTLFLRIADTAPVGENLIGIVNAHTFPFGSTNRINAVPILFNGTVVTNTGPFMAVDPKALTGFEAVPEGVSGSQSFILGGTNLLNLLSVAAPAGYQVSATNASNAFSNTLKFTPAVPGALAQDAGWNYYTNGVRIQGVLTNNTQRGSGFAPWRIIVTNAAGGGAGMFVNDPASAGIGGMSEDSFGLFANPTNASNSVIARRIFNAPLQINETFSFQWGNATNAGTSGNKGVTLIGSNNVPLATLNIAGPPGAITLRVTNGAASNLLTAAGTNAINVSLTRLTTNTVRLVIPAGRDGGVGATNFLSITSTPVGVEFYARALPSGPTDTDRNRAQPYFNNLLITTEGAPTSANVATNVYVRLNGAGRIPGPVSGVVSLFSPGATNKFVELEGAVYDAPLLLPDPSSLAGFFAFQGTASDVKSFTLFSEGLSGTSNTISVGNGFEVSLSASNGFGTNISLPSALAGISSTTNLVYVRVAAGAPLGAPSGTVQIRADGFAGQSVTNFVAVSGNVFAPGGAAQIGQPSPAQITNLRTTLGQASAAQAYVFSAVNLGTANVTANVSSNFQISTRTNGGWGRTVTNAPVGGGITNVTNYVRISANPSTGVTNNLTGAVTLSSDASGASNRIVNLRGEVLAPPALSLSNTNSLTNLWTVQDFQSAPQSFILSGTNLQGAVTITAATNLLVRVGNSGTYRSNAVATNSAAGTLNATINVVIRSNNSVGVLTNTNGITFSTAAATALPSVRTVATVAPRPLITVNPTQLTNFYTVVSNASTPPVPFTVGGSNLLTNITLAISNTGASDKYEMTTNTNVASTWTNSITLVPDYSGTNSSGPPETVAQDNASAANYPGGVWTNGANGGTNFQAWQLSGAPGGAGGFNGNFIGTATNGSGGILTNYASIFSDGVAFSSYAGGDAGAFQDALRPFAQPLGASNTLSHSIGISFENGSKGFTLLNGTNEVFFFNVASGGYTWSGGGSAPMTPWPGVRENGVVINFSATRTATGFDYAISSPQDANLNRSGSVVAPGLSALKYYISGAGGGDQGNLYFNNLLITRPGSGGGTGGVVTNTPVYVRLKATAPEREAQQQIDVTSGTYAAPRTVTLNGYVFPVMDPGLSVDPDELSMQTTQTTASDPASFRVQGSQLGPQVLLELNNTGDFEFSVDAGASWVDGPDFVATTGGFIDRSISVRIKDTAALGLRSGVLKLTSGTDEAEVLLFGAVYEPGSTGTLLIDPAALSGFATIEGDPSPAKIFRVAGRDLSPATVLSATTQISQSAPPYEVSLDGVQYFQTRELPLSPDFGSSLLPTAVYVRLTRSAAPGPQVWQVNLAAGGATGNVQLNGEVTRRPVVAVDPRLLSKFKAAEGKPSLPQSFTVQGSFLMTNTITLTLPPGYEVSRSENTGFGSAPLTLVGTNTNSVSQTRLFLRLASGLPLGDHNGDLSFETLNRIVLMPVTGEVFPNALVPTFRPPVPDGDVRALASPSSGVLYVGGSFGRIGTNNARGLARLSAVTGDFEQALDTGGEVLALAYAPTNTSTNQAWLYAGGRFTNNGTVSLLRRFSVPGGLIDASFAPNLLSPNSQAAARVLALAVQSDGGVLAGGSFSGGLRRVLPAGSVDPDFAASANGQVNTLLLTNGGFLAGGTFTSVAPNASGLAVTRKYLARFHSSGLVDTAFPLAVGVIPSSIGFNGPVNSLAAAPEGRIYVGGNFSGYNGVVPNADAAYQNAAVLPADGSAVNYYGLFTGGEVSAVLARSSGELLAAGSFSMATNAVTATGEIVGGLAQTAVDGILDEDFNGGGTGAAGGSISVAIDLGNGLLALGGSFTSFNGDSNLQKLALLQAAQSEAYTAWATQWFGTSSAPEADPLAVNNPDGLENLVVFALSGGSPFTADASILPLVAQESGYLTLTANKNPAAASTVLYSVQFSEDLMAPWSSENPVPVTVITDTDSLIKARASDPAPSRGRQFLRLMIRLQ
jgi:hypothetical protein